MEKTKRKNAEFNERRYWIFFLPLAIILLLCLRFPIRITLPDLYDDILLYGSISLASLLTGLWIYSRSKWVYRRLLAVVFLCGVLAGWQVIDLAVLRLPTVEYYDDYGIEPHNIGTISYSPRFDNKLLGCLFFWENLYGNFLIAIRIGSYSSAFACEG